MVRDLTRVRWTQEMSERQRLDCEAWDRIERDRLCMAADALDQPQSTLDSRRESRQK